jgi:hypothetical protein
MTSKNCKAKRQTAQLVTLHLAVMIEALEIYVRKLTKQYMDQVVGSAPTSMTVVAAGHC